MFHWRSKRDKYGYVRGEDKVQIYECQFTTTKAYPGNKEPRKSNMKVLVVCDKVEDAIEVCRKTWPENFVLHQISKKNQRCDLIIDKKVLETSENN